MRRIYQPVHQKLSTGTADALTYRCGRKRKLSSEDITRIDKAIQETPDITLAELIEKLNLPCSVPTLDRVVCDKLHYTRKKKMIHAAERERLRCAGEAQRMERVCRKDRQ